ncbi:MAG: hypothetical protein J6Y30_05935 [Treponema sp.]|nr:hypothetical protein [Treponema sp.]
MSRTVAFFWASDWACLPLVEPVFVLEVVVVVVVVVVFVEGVALFAAIFWSEAFLAAAS